ncbi:MAG TPA: hypothetical protein PK265_01125 [Candidatus Saccharibacteria bacterium]|nr:hypothetical protein [Candidatus Saccharibacteria bacterium]HRQ97914.1 hypothetical protein [Candidatus Saccharibacteria bacterium]
MNPLRNTGFTIIESMLFLGITGIMVIALLVGTGVSINTQRYRDSVSTLMSFIQQQYSEVGNVSNSRSNDWSCGSDAETKQDGAPQDRGQSDCFIAGRLIMIAGSDITTLDINGVQTGSSYGSDVSMLANNYRFGVSSVSQDKSSLEWGAKITWPAEGAGSKPIGTDRSLSLLILRSPDSGTVYTFTSDSVFPVDNITSDTIRQIMSPSTSRDKRTICVDSANGLAVGNKLAVFIDANATNSSAVETRSYQTIQSLGGNSKC